MSLGCLLFTEIPVCCPHPCRGAVGYFAGNCLALPARKRWEEGPVEAEPELVMFGHFLNNTLHAAQAECYVFKEKRFFFFLIIWTQYFFLEGFIILSKPGIKPLCNLLI